MGLANNETPFAKKVTVIVATYNHERFISQALDGILMQQVDFAYDIVVIEDCSDDSTPDILRTFRDKHPGKMRLLLAERNRNNNHDWLTEILGARSQYLALMDGDDYWTSPHKLQKQVDYLDRNPRCAICYHNVTIRYEDTSKEAHPFSGSPRKEVSTLADLWLENFIPGCSPMLRQGLVKAFPKWMDAMPWGDWPLYILWAHHGDIGYVDEIMGVYRVHSAGLWAGLSDTEQLTAKLQFFKRMNRNFHFRYRKAIEPMIASHTFRLARIYEQNGAVNKLRLCLLRYMFSASNRSEVLKAILKGKLSGTGETF